jgi:hypothetical protein
MLLLLYNPTDFYAVSTGTNSYVGPGLSYGSEGGGNYDYQSGPTIGNKYVIRAIHGDHLS